jgi:lysozyme
MKLSAAGLELLKEFEGCRLRAYRDGGGVWTVGYGLTTAAGIIEVGPDTRITQAQADEFFLKALVKYERAVLRAIKKPLNQNEFDAMVSLCYNIGETGFAKSSVVRYFNEGNKPKAARSFALWCKDNGKVIPGLVRRREREMALFKKPVEEPKPAPAPEPVVIAAAPAIEEIAEVEVVEPVVIPPAPQPKRLGLWAWVKKTFFGASWTA